MNSVVSRLHDEHLTYHVEENINPGASFFVDTFTEIHAGRITYWNTTAIHAHIITAMDEVTVYSHHGFIEDEHALRAILDRYTAILNGR